MEVRQQNTSTIKNEIINNLRYFSGSEIYYTHRTFGYGFSALTEGTKYLRDACNCYWLFDLILSHQYKLREEQFQQWELCQAKGGTWVITCTDGNHKTLVSQDIKFSDFPLNGIVLWKIEGNVICLPSEY